MNVEKEELLQSLVRLLKEKGWTLSLAESCTGGLASASLVELSGISSVFQGSVISYSDEIKENILGVEKSLIEEYGAVSEVVAASMAQGANGQMRSDWTVSITGVAGPTGGTEAKPVGTVCFGLIGPGIEKTERRKFAGNRKEIQKQSVQRAFELLKENISEQ